MKKIEIRADGSRRVYTVNQQPSKTDQSYKTECDVNNILSKYVKTGEITHTARKPGSYADVSNVQDLLTSYQKIQTAQQKFNELSPKIRDRFQNPQKLIQFLQDPKNMDEAERLGLITFTDESGLELAPAATKRKRGRDEEVGPEEQPGGMEADGTRSPRGKAPKEQKTQQTAQ